MQRCQVQATLIITTTLSYSSHFTYFFAVLAFISVGSEKKPKENLMGEGNLKTTRMNYFKSPHNIKLRTTYSRKKGFYEGNRRLDRKVLIRLPIRQTSCSLRTLPRVVFIISVIIIIITLITGWSDDICAREAVSNDKHCIYRVL